MKKRIHINQHNIRHNNKHPEDRKPVVTKLIYSPDKPLSCGARVWIETESELSWITEAEFGSGYKLVRDI